jgi:dipeptidyl aminopeptidase/acylaminoacyl peptidase
MVVGCRETAAPTPLSAVPPEPKLRKLTPGHSAQWTADGRIVYVDAKGGDVWNIRPNGEHSRRLVRMRADLGLLVSPDRSRLLLLRTGKSFVARADGRLLRPIASVSQASTAWWSDDGTKITFARLRGTQRSIWTVPSRGGRPERLFPEFGGAVLAWAPDGRMIVRAFQEGQGGSFRATLLMLPGDEPRELPELIEARFGPEGTIEGIEAQGTLVLLDEQGEVLRRFPGADPIHSLPDYTSDGTLMVYEQGGRLWIAFADWTWRRVLADAPCYRPAFSPDDNRVACSLVTTRRGSAQRHVAVIGVPADLRLKQP